MRILYISNSIIPSTKANSVHVMKMCQAYANNGHDVTLLAPNNKNNNKKNVKDLYEYYGVKKNFKIKKLWYPNLKGRAILYTLSIFFYLIFTKKFNMVYGRFLYGCYIATLLKNKVIFELHDPIYERRNFELIVFTKLVKSNSLKKIVVISDELKKIFLKKNFLNPDKIMVAHDGADEVKDFLNKSVLLGVKKNIKVGYVGNLYKGKGIEIISSISSKVKEDVEFHIIGGNEYDIQFWKNKISSSNVFFYGFISQGNLSSYINSLDICLLPNQMNLSISGVGNISSYTSPLKLFDYMSHKKAIIASDIKVFREVLNEENSILVKYDNDKEWVNAIEKLKIFSFRKKIEEQALKDFHFYSWSNRVKRILK